MRRWLFRLGSAILVLLLLAVSIVAWLAFGSLPKLDGELRLAGLQRPVQILRDAHAVPHIIAETEADAYFAVGFVHGQDRLWQMEFYRRLGQGRLAEVLGGEALSADRFMRTLGLARRAEAAVAGLELEARAKLEAYAQGVNAAIARFGHVLPPEFLIFRHRPEPWRPADSVLFQKLMALDLSENWREELLRARAARVVTPAQLQDMWPEPPADTPVTLTALKTALMDLPLDALDAALPPAVPEGIGSNSWVVAGTRTRTGAPLLANDPHLRLQAPGLWYLAHIEAPGLGVVGATLPSLPFVVLGHNRDVAWGFTNTGSDTQDLFIERIDPADPDRYLTPTGSEPFATRREEIRVGDGPPVVLEVRETRHGPVISDLVPSAEAIAGAGHVLALAWTQLRDEDRTVEAGFAIGKSRDWPSFVAAVERYQGAQQNMSFAARDGTIGMISPGRVPIRRAGDGRFPVPGWTGEFDWTGLIPVAELPRQVNPPGGLLFNANNRLVDASYPYFLTAGWDPPWRARRLQALLGKAGNLDMAGMAAVQLDIVSTHVADFLPQLLATPAGSPLEREIFTALAGWNGEMRADRPEPLIVTAWYRELGAAIYADELKTVFPAFRSTRSDFVRHVLTRAPAWCDDIGTPVLESCADRSALALRTSLADLAARYGPDWRQWRWGEAHPAVMAHRPFEEVRPLRDLFSIVLPVGGDASTINVAHPGATRDELPFSAVHAATYRAIYDLAAPDNARFALATGQSGHPLSAHYRDLSRKWQAGTYIQIDTASDTIAQKAINRLTLRP